MADCKYYYDEFCVNDKCPMCADYCPVPNTPDVCKWENRNSIIFCKDCKNFEPSDSYSKCSKTLMGIVSPDDYCSRGDRK